MTSNHDVVESFSSNIDLYIMVAMNLASIGLLLYFGSWIVIVAYLLFPWILTIVFTTYFRVKSPFLMTEISFVIYSLVSFVFMFFTVPWFIGKLVVYVVCLF